MAKSLFHNDIIAMTQKLHLIAVVVQGHRGHQQHGVAERDQVEGRAADVLLQNGEMKAC